MTRFRLALMARARGYAIAISVAVLLSACAAAPPPKPQPLSFSIESAADLNPDANGRASPVVVRIYQLSTDADFLQADFFALYSGEDAALGKTLLGMQEVIAVPGEKTSVRLDMADETNVLGIVVAFRDIDHASWRLTSPTKGLAPTLKLTSNSAQWAAHP